MAEPTDAVTTDATRDAARGEMADTVIISVFGRGDWLATELAQRGFKVTLIDATASLGACAPEDAEGPFGFSEVAELSSSQKTRLTEEGDVHTVRSGFTLWLEDGPIECRSEMTQFQLASRNIPEQVESYLRQAGAPDRGSDRGVEREVEREIQRLRAAVRKLPFEDAWLAHFAHQIASNSMSESHRALDTGMPLPLFAPFSLRQATASSSVRALKLCQSGGVTVRPKAKVRDLRFEGRALEALEIEDDRSGIERSKTFVWTLSSAESQVASPKVFEMLFPDGALIAEWYWSRYRIDLESVDNEDPMPIHSVLLADPYLPWSHTNLIVLRKRSETKSYDAWVRLPVRVHLDPGYLHSIGQDVEAILKKRIPALRPTLHPLEPSTASPARQKIAAWIPMPVYGSGQLEKFRKLRAPNLFFCGPEQWDSLGWSGRFRQQNSILLQLERLRMSWLHAAEKARTRSANP